jgi:two-component system sensor histidine kinase KdpD
MRQEKNKNHKLYNFFKSVKKQFLFSVITISITTLLCYPLANTQNYHLVSYILLFVVSLLSTFLAIGPVLLSSTLSALIWNYFFIPPHYTFHIEKTEDILIFTLFFTIALVNGILTTRIRRQEQLAREREKRTNVLFQLTKELSKSGGTDEVIEVALAKIKEYFSFQTLFILQDGNNILNSSGQLQKEKKLNGAEYEIAKWVFTNKQPAGAYTQKFEDCKYTFYPLIGNRINPGVVAIEQMHEMPNEYNYFWDTFTAQISNALEREFLGELAQKVRFLDESDRLYKTLFNSISHELRIPVATIMGAADTILNASESKHIRLALSKEIFTASLRLNRIIENLLNISRIESGHISIRLNWCDINDLINKVTVDLQNELKPFKFSTNVSPNMPLVKIDFGLMEQVLYNLLFNATEYTPEGQSITLAVDYAKNELFIDVINEGTELSSTELQNIFKKFYRAKKSKTGGLGLGLSIVKGFIDAHNGTISAKNTKNQEVCFHIEIPSEKPDIITL